MVYRYTAFAIIFLFATSYRSAEKQSRDEVLLKMMMDGIGTHHYLVKDVNDEFSRDVFELYIKRLDGNKRLFLQSDIDQFDTWKEKIDDEIRSSSFTFFTLTESVWNERMKETASFIEDILAQPFDFSGNEEIVLDPDMREFAKTTEERKEMWRISLKHQTLSRIWETMKEEEAAKENKPDAEIKEFAILESEARERVLKNNRSWLDRMEMLETDDLRSTFLNSVANAIDPHTAYFPPEDKEDFDIGMSGQLEGIGATLTQRDGYTKVERIVPGSPSARQGELEGGDVILKVAQGNEEAVDIVDMRLDKAVRLIRGPKGTVVRLTVKKGDASVKLISIIRDVVVLSETYAKSSILKIEGSEANVGYIRLPKFYADFNGKEGRSCAKDVEQEIVKLRKQNVSGIILDLRNNGGGSLQDVVDMTGLFIETGPIVQVKSRGGSPYVLADRNPALQFDGPVVVLVNAFSASASEIMAAAMQDYGRAIVIGTGPTFGKGTVQRFFDLDQALEGNQDIKPLGSIKLTTQKFYRINGGTTQLNGVIPDIVLPDVYSQIEIGERENEFPMVCDMIDPVTFGKWDKYQVALSDIGKSSVSRTGGNEFFRKMAENSARWKENRDRKTVTLNYEAFVAESRVDEEEAKRYEDLSKAIAGFSSITLPEDSVKIVADSSLIALNEDFHDSNEKDSYLWEAMQVIREMAGKPEAVAGKEK